MEKGPQRRLRWSSPEDQNTAGSQKPKEKPLAAQGMINSAKCP